MRIDHRALGEPSEDNTLTGETTGTRANNPNLEMCTHPFIHHQTFAQINVHGSFLTKGPE